MTKTKIQDRNGKHYYIFQEVWKTRGGKKKSSKNLKKRGVKKALKKLKKKVGVKKKLGVKKCWYKTHQKFCHILKMCKFNQNGNAFFFKKKSFFHL